MHPDEVRERIEELDSRNPIRDPASIERMIKWAYEHAGFPGCRDECLRRHCRRDNCFHAALQKGQTEGNQDAGRLLPEHQND